MIRNKLHVIIVLICIPLSSTKAQLEKAMAPHSSTLAWKIPWTGEPGGLQSMGLLSWTRLNDFSFIFALSCIGEGHGNPLQCSCLENPRDGGAWWGAVYGIAHVRLFATSWTVARQAPLSMEFSRQECWSGSLGKCKIK